MKEYNAADVTIIVAGIPISGFSDGDVITVERDEDAFTKQVGTDGEVTRSKSNNKTGTATITLMQTSSANALLSALAALDELTGAGVGSFQMKDNSGYTVHSAQNSWVRKMPSSTWAREAGPREWVVDLDKLIAYEGGN